MNKKVYNYEHTEKRIRYKKEYYQTHKKEINEKSRRWAQEHRDRINMLARERTKKNPEKAHATDLKHRQKRKLEAFQKISGLKKPVCANCGCNDLRFLEINHINGGGAAERKRGTFVSAKHFRQMIIKNKRKTDDLNVLCRVCNSLDYLKRKYGKVPIKIFWDI